MSGGHEDQRLCRTNYLNLFQNCDVPEEVSGTFDPEIDFEDDAVSHRLSYARRSRYERFYSVLSIYQLGERKSEPSMTFTRALKEISRVFKKRRKLRRLTGENISKNIPKSSKIHDYVLRDVM